LVSEAKALAHGIVFEIPDTKLLAVRHKEGVVTGIAVEQRIRVELKDGKTIEALAYSVSPERRSLEGPVSESFIKTLCAAYDKWGLEVPSYR
jgi:cation transport regulator ChaC